MLAMEKLLDDWNPGQCENMYLLPVAGYCSDSSRLLPSCAVISGSVKGPMLFVTQLK